jgi:phosphohistidine phosphatase
VSKTDRAAVIRLHLLRHAHAGDPEAWTADDAARPLSAKGVEQAERLAAFLATHAFVADAIVSSPKVRARQTAEIVAVRLELTVRIDDRLAEGFSAADVDALLGEAGQPSRPILVGHDPDFSELLSWVTGSDGLTMKKGAFARIDVRGRVGDGQGTLRWLMPPDLLETEPG